MPEKPIYRVVFFNQGKVYEVYAKRVGQGDLYGFIDVSGLIFGARSSRFLPWFSEQWKGFWRRLTARGSMRPGRFPTGCCGNRGLSPVSVEGIRRPVLTVMISGG